MVPPTERPTGTRRLVLSLILVALAAAGACRPQESRQAQTPASANLSGPTPADPTVVRSAAGGLRLGMSYGGHLPDLNPGVVGRALDDDLALGVGWIRFDFAWDAIQPASPDTYDWSMFDTLVGAVTQRHLMLLPVLQYTPIWARPQGCTSDHCRPADPGRFAAFAAACARRYVPLGVHAWEVWNEPNTTGAWLPAPDPAGYALLASAASHAIKDVDPSATIVSGGLAPSETGAGNLSQVDFLNGFAEAGGLSAIDAVGDHPYSFPLPPSHYADWNNWSQISATPRSLHATLKLFGFPTMKVWATEYGAPTNGPGHGATTDNDTSITSADHVDETLQARMASQSVELAKRSPAIGALFWYTQTDAGTSTSTRENFFGLRRFDGTAKPSYDALSKAIAKARR